MVRSILPTLILGVAAEESLMQFEKSGHSDSGASRTSAMQHSAQAMVDSYQKLLQDIVNAGSLKDPNTGSSYVPAKDVLDQVIGTFEGFESDLNNQKLANQGILDMHDQNVVDCNIAKDAAFNKAGTGVVALKSAMQKARGVHASCRNSEDDEIKTMEDDCDAFKKKTRCEPKEASDQNWYSNSAVKGEFANSLQDTIAQAKTCRGSVAAVSSRAPVCDENQASFEAAFCAYGAALEQTCQDLDTCYSQTTLDKAAADTSISKLEKEQKIIFRMVSKVRCFLDLLVKAAEDTSKMPKQSDIDGCTGIDYTGDANTELSITYDAAAAKSPCRDDSRVSDEPALDLPGSQDWYAGELADYEKHGKLTAMDACE